VYTFDYYTFEGVCQPPHRQVGPCRPRTLSHRRHPSQLRHLRPQVRPLPVP